jgi:putative DNA methylase
LARESADAAKQLITIDKVVSTDPPYYDNIGYADLSDFFYVWLRRSLRRFPDLFRHAGGAQGRGTGRHALPPRRQGEGRDLFPRRHDASDAPARRAGTPGLPCHHLLRLQAVRERGRIDGTTSNTGWDTFLAAVIELALPSAALGRCEPS